MLRAAGVSYTRIIQVIVILGTFSLGCWGAIAGRRANLTGWALAASVGYGLLLGALILILQTLLRPGPARCGSSTRAIATDRMRRPAQPISRRRRVDDHEGGASER